MTSPRARPLFSLFATLALSASAHQATGIKLTEPTADSITVWTRVTRDAERAPDDGPLPITKLFDRTTGKVFRQLLNPGQIMFLNLIDHKGVGREQLQRVFIPVGLQGF